MIVAQEKLCKPDMLTNLLLMLLSVFLISFAYYCCLDTSMRPIGGLLMIAFLGGSIYFLGWKAAITFAFGCYLGGKVLRNQLATSGSRD